MITIIFTVLGILFILIGFGIRPIVKAFGTAFAIFGFLFLLNGILGWYLNWNPQLQLWIAGGILIVFTIVTTIWQLRVKHKEFQKLAKQNHQQ